MERYRETFFSYVSAIPQQISESIKKKSGKGEKGHQEIHFSNEEQ